MYKGSSKSPELIHVTKLPHQTLQRTSCLVRNSGILQILITSTSQQYTIYDRHTIHEIGLSLKVKTIFIQVSGWPEMLKAPSGHWPGHWLVEPANYRLFSYNYTKKIDSFLLWQLSFCNEKLSYRIELWLKWHIICSLVQLSYKKIIWGKSDALQIWVFINMIFANIL